MFVFSAVLWYYYRRKTGEKARKEWLLSLSIAEGKTEGASAKRMALATLPVFRRKNSVSKIPALNRRQKEVLAHLLAGYTQKEAAAAVGVAEATVSRWKHNDPIFIAGLNAGRQALYEAGINELLSVRRAAVQVLGQLIQDEATSDQVRLKAIDMTMRFCPQPAGETDPVTLERNRPWWQARNLRALMKEGLPALKLLSARTEPIDPPLPKKPPQ